MPHEIKIDIDQAMSEQRKRVIQKITSKGGKMSCPPFSQAAIKGVF